jgi:hypothetical protein
MTLKEQIMKLQTYKMYEGENAVYVERDDVLKVLEQELESTYKYGVLHKIAEFFQNWDGKNENAKMEISVEDMREIADVYTRKALIERQLKEIKPIGYRECSDAMLKMWMDNVLTDGEYYRIMDKLNTKWSKMNEVET